MAAEPMKCVDHSSAAATVGVAPWRQISPSPYRVLAHQTRASRKVSSMHDVRAPEGRYALAFRITPRQIHSILTACQRDD
jgi:hypothetical protein